jgi:Rrf2 family protein
MKVTYRGDYALKTVLDLAVNYDKGLSTTSDIASRIDAPVKFLEQILLDLKKGGFVESRRGKEGGYVLAKGPARISVGDVVRFIDGPIEPIACLEKGYAGCTDLYKCVFRPIWSEVVRSISGVVDNINFATLARQAQTNKEALVYQI